MICYVKPTSLASASATGGSVHMQHISWLGLCPKDLGLSICNFRVPPDAMPSALRGEGGTRMMGVRGSAGTGRLHLFTHIIQYVMSSISRGSVARCLAILNLQISAATVSRWSLFSRLLPGIAVAAPAQSIRARRRRFPCVGSGALAAITLAPMLEHRTRPQAVGVADGHLNLAKQHHQGTD